MTRSPDFGMLALSPKAPNSGEFGDLVTAACGRRPLPAQLIRSLPSAPLLRFWQIPWFALK